VSHSSGESRSRTEATSRAQTEPIAALVALTVVGVGLSLYAGALVDVTPEPDRDRAASVFERVHDEVVVVGVARPARLTVPSAAPSGATVGVALVTRHDRWSVGAAETERPFPDDADVATGPVSVRVAPGEIRSGEIRVVIRP